MSFGNDSWGFGKPWMRGQNLNGYGNQPRVYAPGDNRAGGYNSGYNTTRMSGYNAYNQGFNARRTYRSCTGGGFLFCACHGY